MNNIDKVIITNIKMKERNLGINISSIVAVLIGVIIADLASSSEFWLLWIIPVALWGIQREYDKIFFISIFGDTALLYNSLPIKTKDNVIGKVLSASFIVLWYIGCLILLYVLELVLEEGFWDNFSISYSFVAMKSLQLITIVISVISQSTYIFWAVVIFNTKLKKGYSKITKLVFVLMAGMIFMLLYYIPLVLYITDVINDELMMTLISFALAATLIIPMGHKIILLLDSKYVYR